MTIILTNTSQITKIETGHGDQVPALVWIGRTEAGVEVECLITRLAVRVEADQS